MGLINFALLLSHSVSTAEPEPEPELHFLVWDDSSVEFTGAQTEASIIAGSHNLYAPAHIHHNGKTYFCYQGVYQSKGKGQGYILVYDKNNGLKRPYRVGNILGDSVFGVGDSHTKPTFDVDKFGNLFMFQEETHDSPIAMYKASDFNFFERLSEAIGTELSYLHTFKDGSGNGINWCRMNDLYDADGGHLAYVKASNGYESWGSEVRVSTNPRPVTSTSDDRTDRTRHYPQIPYYNCEDADYYYLLGSQRTDDLSTGLGIWNIMCIFRTPKTGSDSFVKYQTVFGTEYEHDITGGNYITESDLANFEYYNSGGAEYNTSSPVSTLNDGHFFCVLRKAENSDDLVLIHINLATRVRTIINLNIEDYLIVDPTTSQVHAVKHIAYYNGKLEVGILIVTGGLNKPYLFRSDDFGATFESIGDMLADQSVSINTFSFPWNYYSIPDNENFLITFVQNDSATTNTRKIFSKRAAKGAIQTETPTVVVANTNYSDAHDLWDYQFGDGQITRSGNNITGITDQFGLRNATGVNNPQWNGSNAATLNGTTNYFSIPTTGLTALTKLTLFAVFRTVSGGNANLLTFANNALSDAFLAIFGANSTDANGPVALFRKTTLTQLRDFANVATNDNNLKLLTVVCDGRCKWDFYINGQKSFYNTTGDDARLVDRGNLNFGTVTNIRIGHNASTNSYTALTLQQHMAKHNVYMYEDQRAIEKQIADMHGITLNYGYE